MTTPHAVSKDSAILSPEPSTPDRARLPALWKAGETPRGSFVPSGRPADMHTTRSPAIREEESEGEDEHSFQGKRTSQSPTSMHSVRSQRERVLNRRLEDAIASGRSKTTWLEEAMKGAVDLLDRSDSSSSDDLSSSAWRKRPGRNRKSAVAIGAADFDPDSESDSDRGSPGKQSQSTRSAPVEPPAPVIQQMGSDEEQAGMKLGVGVDASVVGRCGWASPAERRLSVLSEASSKQARPARGFRWSTVNEGNNGNTSGAMTCSQEKEDPCFSAGSPGLSQSRDNSKSVRKEYTPSTPAPPIPPPLRRERWGKKLGPAIGGLGPSAPPGGRDGGIGTDVSADATRDRKSVSSAALPVSYQSIPSAEPVVLYSSISGADPRVTAAAGNAQATEINQDNGTDAGLGLDYHEIPTDREPWLGEEEAQHADDTPIYYRTDDEDGEARDELGDGSLGPPGMGDDSRPNSARMSVMSNAGPTPGKTARGLGATVERVWNETRVLFGPLDHDEAQQSVRALQAQLLDSSRELEDAAAEIDRLVARNTLLEQELDATGAQLHDARAHASLHVMALSVLEKEAAEAQRSKKAADRSAEAEVERLQQETQRLQDQLGRNQVALQEAENSSLKDTEAAERIMQETAKRLEKVGNAWMDAQHKAQALAAHSSHLSAQLDDKNVSLSAAQASQDLAMSRVRALEQERSHLQRSLTTLEALHKKALREAAEAAAVQQAREGEQARAIEKCSQLERTVAELEAALQTKDRVLQMQAKMLTLPVVSCHALFAPGFPRTSDAAVRRRMAWLQQGFLQTQPVPGGVPCATGRDAFALQPPSPEAIVAPSDDSPIKGIVFSRVQVADKGDVHVKKGSLSPCPDDSPREARQASPRPNPLQKKSPRKNASRRLSPAELTAELGYLQADMTIASLTPPTVPSPSFKVLGPANESVVVQRTSRSRAGGADALDPVTPRIIFTPRERRRESEAERERNLTPRIIQTTPRKAQPLDAPDAAERGGRGYGDDRPLPSTQPREPRDLDTVSTVSAESDPITQISEYEGKQPELGSARPLTTEQESGVLSSRGYELVEARERLKPTGLTLNDQPGTGTITKSSDQAADIPADAKGGDSLAHRAAQEHLMARDVLDQQEKYLQGQIHRLTTASPVDSLRVISREVTNLSALAAQDDSKVDTTRVQRDAGSMPNAPSVEERMRKEVVSTLELLDSQTSEALSALQRLDARMPQQHHEEDAMQQEKFHGERLERLAGQLHKLDEEKPERTQSQEHETFTIDPSKLQADPLRELERQLEALDELTANNMSAVKQHKRDRDHRMRRLQQVHMLSNRTRSGPQTVTQSAILETGAAESDSTKSVFVIAGEGTPTDEFDSELESWFQTNLKEGPPKVHYQT